MYTVYILRSIRNGQIYNRDQDCWLSGLSYGSIYTNERGATEAIKHNDFNEVEIVKMYMQE